MNLEQVLGFDLVSVMVAIAVIGGFWFAFQLAWEWG